MLRTAGVIRRDRSQPVYKLAAEVRYWFVLPDNSWVARCLSQTGEAAPAAGPSGRCGFRAGTFAGTAASGRDALVIWQVLVCQAAQSCRARKPTSRFVTFSCEPIRLRQNYHRTAIWRLLLDAPAIHGPIWSAMPNRHACLLLEQRCARSLRIWIHTWERPSMKGCFHRCNATPDVYTQGHPAHRS